MWRSGQSLASRRDKARNGPGLRMNCMCSRATQTWTKEEWSGHRETLQDEAWAVGKPKSCMAIQPAREVCREKLLRVKAYLWIWKDHFFYLKDDGLCWDKSVTAISVSRKSRGRMQMAMQGMTEAWTRWEIWGKEMDWLFVGTEAELSDGEKNRKKGNVHAFWRLSSGPKKLSWCHFQGLRRNEV